MVQLAWFRKTDGGQIGCPDEAHHFSALFNAVLMSEVTMKIFEMAFFVTV